MAFDNDERERLENDLETLGMGYGLTPELKRDVIRVWAQRLMELGWARTAKLEREWGVLNVDYGVVYEAKNEASARIHYFALEEAGVRVRLTNRTRKVTRWSGWDKELGMNSDDAA